MGKSRFYHEAKTPLPSPQEMEALQIFVNSIGLFQCAVCGATWFPHQGTDCPNPSCLRYYQEERGYCWPAGGQAEANARRGDLVYLCLGKPGQIIWKQIANTSDDSKNG